MISCSRCGTENPEGARFCNACAAPLVAASPQRETRKTVTVVFCDVVGSTALGERTDPETLRRVMSRYFDAMRGVLERHGGTVEKFIGDAVVAVFGIPVVHEDDALRAARAAVGMRDALEALNAALTGEGAPTLSIRVGVNTGDVVAGDPAAGQALVTGDAVNVAARLEQAAVPGEILIGALTYQLIANAVIVEATEPLDLKGKAQPLAAYRLLKVSAEAEGYIRRTDSPLVGRDHERELLGQAFARVAHEQSCGLVTVLGSPGVGKSRLTEEFLGSVSAEATVVRGRCLPYGDGITFWPVAEVVRSVAALGEETDPEVVTAAIRVAIEATESDDDTPIIAARVAQVIGAGDPGEPAASREESFWAIRHFLERLAAARPLVVVIEDIHWAEPTMLELIEHVADLSRGAPILLLCTSRPELLDRHPTWAGGKMNATSMLLEPLSEDESAVLVSNLLGRVEVEAGARTRIARAAEGNPLFVEQLLSMLIDDGTLRRTNAHWEVDGDLRSLAIPPTIQALLAARVDRLQPQERALLERASVVGRVFYSDAVWELSEAPDQPQLAARLASLVRKELIRPDRSDFAWHDAFRFRHQLIRDVAYASVPKETRAGLHERFADWLLGAMPAGGQQDELVGYHLEQACLLRAELGPATAATLALAERAAGHLSTAGRLALSRGDLGGATQLLSRAAALLPAASTAKVDLLVELGHALDTFGELERAVAVAEEAIAHAETLGMEAAAWRARILSSSTRSVLDPHAWDNQTLEAQAREAIAAFERLGDDRGMADAWVMLSEIHNNAGDMAASLEACRAAFEFADRIGDQALLRKLVTWIAGRMYFGSTRPDEALEQCRELFARLPATPYTQGQLLLTEGRMAAKLGQLDESRKLLLEAKRIFEDLGTPRGVVATTGFGLTFTEQLAGEWEAVEGYHRLAISILQGKGERAAASTLAGGLAEALFRQGRLDEAEEWLERCREWAADDDLASQLLYRATMGELLAARGRIDEGLALALEGTTIAERTDFGWNGSAYVSVARIQRLAGDREAALAAAHRALDLQEQKGVVLEIAATKALIESLERD